MKATRTYTASGFFVLRTPLLPLEALSADDLLWRADVREAIFVASPTAHALMESGDPAIEPALRRYLARMAGRATPFGLFAGVSTGRIAAVTDLALAGPPRRVTRLEAEGLVEGEGDLLRPNPTLYPVADRRRFIDPREHLLVSVRDSAA